VVDDELDALLPELPALVLEGARGVGKTAAASATTASFETIRDAATGSQGDKPAKRTTEPYRDILSRLWILDPLSPWIPSRNTLNRLSQSPKHHLADPGLAVRLLGMDRAGLLSGDEAGNPIADRAHLLGNLFESLVALCLRVYAQAVEANVYHLQLHGGRHEIVINSGPVAYRRPDGIGDIPAALLSA
jgi:uncharacterized protein